MPKRNLLKLLTLLTLLVVSGFGCQGLSSTQQAAIQPISLEYWTVFDDVDALQSLVNQYTQDRPYLSVRIRQLGAGEIYERLVEALAEDKGPDIISVNNRSLGTYLSKLAALPPTVSDTLVQVQHGQFNDTTTIIPQTRDTVTLSQLDREYVQAVKGDAVRGGLIYGLPLSFDTMALYYNKDLLDRFGIAEPPKNWEEFQADVKKLTKYDKTTGKIIQAGAALGTGKNVPGYDDLLYVLFKQSRVPFVSRSGQAAFSAIPQNLGRGDETPAMSVMDFYTDYANPTRDTYSWSETMPNALDSFANGTLAFFFGYNYHLPMIRARAPQLNFEVMPLLQLDAEAPANVANYSLQSVLAKSKHKNEAWALITYLTHSGATKNYLDKTGRPTALRAYITGQKENLALAPFISQVLIADNWYRGSNYDAANRAIGDMLHEWFLPPPDQNNPLDWKQTVLNRGAAKVNQTL